MDNAKAEAAIARRRCINGDWMATQGAGKAWAASITPRASMPCLLHANIQGYRIGSRGRHASLPENSRAQGLTAAGVQWPAHAKAFAFLGKTMALCILQRLMHIIFCGWGILLGPDPWERGELPAVF